MDNIEETDNITKNIVQEIVRECMKTNIKINANFCTYYVKLLTLDPMWRISPERKMNRGNIQTLVSFIIEKVKTVQNPSLTTMKIQQYFLAQMSAKENIIEHQREILTESAEPLMVEILTTNCTEANRARITKRIILYIALMSGLGNPKSHHVIKETTYSLKSIEEVDDYHEFAAMKPEDKLAHILSMQPIVSGIRLFNRDSGRNIAEIDDLPKMLIQALTAVNAELQSTLQTMIQKVNLKTTALQNMFYITNVYTKQDNILTFRIKLMKVIVPGIIFEDVNHVMEMLVLCRQYEVYIRNLLIKLKELEISVQNLITDLANRLTQMHHTVKYRIAIATATVYPLFNDLWNIWTQLQNESFVLYRYAHVFKKIHVFASKESLDNDKIKLMIADTPVLTDAQRLELQQDEKIILAPESVCELFDLSQLKDNIELEFLGFCIWSLTETKGALFPGNPNMGVLQWKGLYYSFAYPEGAYVFGNDPDKVIHKAYAIIRKKSELINLFKLQDKLHHLRNISISYIEPSILLQRFNKNIQTDTHPLPSEIDPNYMWNVWDCYRQAARLTTIAGYATHSVQTIKSNYRNSVRVQSLEPCERETQTKQNNSTNVETPLNFIYGLRGRSDDKQHIIELTRQVDEDKYRKYAAARENPPQSMMTEIVKCRKIIKPPKKQRVPSSLANTPSDYSFMQPESVGTVAGTPAELQLRESCVCVKDSK